MALDWFLRFLHRRVTETQAHGMSYPDWEVFSTSSHVPGQPYEALRSWDTVLCLNGSPTRAGLAVTSEIKLDGSVAPFSGDGVERVKTLDEFLEGAIACLEKSPRWHGCAAGGWFLCSPIAGKG